eukprot:322627-Karenia_brevis.AAC.1
MSECALSNNSYSRHGATKMHSPLQCRECNKDLVYNDDVLLGPYRKDWMHAFMSGTVDMKEFTCRDTAECVRCKTERLQRNRVWHMS